LNAVARADADWLAEHALPDWWRHYASRIEDSRFPRARSKRIEVGRRIGADGMHLLQSLFSPGAPPALRLLPQVETLRRAWVQHFQIVEGEVRRRDPKDRPPGVKRLVNPYDLDARTGVKRDVAWDGYKVHLTETCDRGLPHLITNVATTVGSVSDDRISPRVHAELARRGLLPDEHWVDTGYANSTSLALAHRDYGITLHGPLRPATVAQSRGDAAYGQQSFHIDWDNQEATCPNGRTSSQWRVGRTEENLPVIRVRFSPTVCKPCPELGKCAGSSKARRRELSLRPRAEHEALQQARTLQATDEWKERYKIRAGVEGTISQAANACGLRKSRYRGLPKTSLQHQLTGAAINLMRIDAWITRKPRSTTRSSPLTALRPTG
jgi:hypothetical protein